MQAGMKAIRKTPRIAALAIGALVVCSSLLLLAPHGYRQGLAKLSEAPILSAVRHLVYTTVGGDEAYVRCLKWQLLSLSQKSPQPNFHVVIIVDHKAKSVIEAIVPLRQLTFSIEFMILDPSLVDKPREDPAVAISSRKLDIFRYQHLSNFTNVMYLDSDYIVTLDVARVLNIPLQSEILYSHEETMNMMTTPPEQRASLHNLKWWGFMNYTKEEIAVFKERQIHPFSAGWFLFRYTPQMMQDFKELKTAMGSLSSGYFYVSWLLGAEQSFLNYFFNTKLRSNTSLLTPYYLETWTLGNAAGTYSFDNKMFHSVHTSASGGAAKEAQLRYYYHCEVLGQHYEKAAALNLLLGNVSAVAVGVLPEEKRANWWQDMGHIGQVPRQVDRYFKLAEDPSVKTICEVGFNAGHSTAVFMSANSKATMYSFDIMALPYSYHSVSFFKSRHQQRFHFIKGSSFDTVPWLHATHPDIKCDLFSVDGDHSYEGALTDYLNALAVMKTGATLVADDTSDRFPGCKRAFEEVTAAGYLTQVTCESPAQYDLHAAAAGAKRWCWGTVSVPKRKFSVPRAAAPQVIKFDIA